MYQPPFVEITWPVMNDIVGLAEASQWRAGSDALQQWTERPGHLGLEPARSDGVDTDIPDRQNRAHRPYPDLGERHLRTVLARYGAVYNGRRPHERCDSARHGPIIPPWVSSANGSGADRFSEG
jgi:hypothetical protein